MWLTCPVELCDKAHLHTHKRAQRDSGRIILAQIIPQRAAHKPIAGAMSPSKGHCPGPEEHRDVQWQIGTQIKDLKGTTGLSRPLPRIS